MEKNLFNINKRIIFIFLASLFCLATLPCSALASANLLLSPASGSHVVSNIFSVSVKLNTGGDAINAAQADLTFDKNHFIVDSINADYPGHSIFNTWVSFPSFDNTAGTINFVGGIPNPGYTGSSGTIFSISFKGIAQGSGDISFSASPSPKILLNDGIGTDDFGTAAGGAYTILPVPQFSCGDGRCDAGENPDNCCQDCGGCLPDIHRCGDGTCDANENSDNCCQDCGGCLPGVGEFCGDNHCNGNETCSTCSRDCGDCVTPPPIIPPTVPPVVINEIKKIIADPVASAITKAITAAGVIISVAAIAFSSPISFTEIFLLPFRLFSFLFSTYILRKRVRPWGTVYDSITKQPLDPAYVVLNNLKGKEIDTAITDLDGRFGFLVPPGKYTIKVDKSHHTFPSQKLAGKTSDELYDNLYFGEPIEVKKAGGAIIKNIPLDPTEFDWNEFAKKNKGLMTFYSKIDNWLSKISSIFFVFGYMLALVAYYFAPFPYNTIILVLYLFLLFLKLFGIRPKSFGSIIEKETKAPLSFAVLRVALPDANIEIKHAVADKLGRYYCLVPKGIYNLAIERKNQDGSYSPVFSLKNYNTKKGIVRERFKV